jgi:hypothetical protein
MNDTITFILYVSMILVPALIASWHIFNGGSSNAE